MSACDEGHQTFCAHLACSLYFGFCLSFLCVFFLFRVFVVNGERSSASWSCSKRRRCSRDWARRSTTWRRWTSLAGRCVTLKNSTRTVLLLWIPGTGNNIYIGALDLATRIYPYLVIVPITNFIALSCIFLFHLSDPYILAHSVIFPLQSPPPPPPPYFDSSHHLPFAIFFPVMLQ